MDVRALKSLFFQDFEGLTEVFAPGRPPGYPRGRPRDIRPRIFLGCFSVPDLLLLAISNRWRIGFEIASDFGI